GRPPKPLDPNVSSAALLGSRLRRLREERGLSQQRLASLVSFSSQHVGAVERGAAPVSGEFVAECDAALDAGGCLLELFPAVVAERAAERHRRQSRRRAEQGRFSDRSRGGVPPGIPEVSLPGAVPARAAAMGAARQPRVSRIDAALVEDLELVTDSHRRLYHRLKSSELLAPVTSHLRVATCLLEGAATAPLRRRLAAIAVEAAGLAAWLAFDLNNDRMMKEYYRQSVAAVDEAGDRALGAYVVGFRAAAAMGLADLRASLRHLGEANGRAAHSATATMQAWLAGLHAQAWAMTSDASSCRCALRRADTAMGRARPDEDPAWMYAFDRARLAGQRGACFLALRRPHDARAALREALASLGPTCSRHRANLLVDLACTHLQTRDLAEACRLLHVAHEIFVEAGSAAGLRRIERLCAKLRPWERTAAVRALYERLRAPVTP
ncbi:MAG: helix-turn-helix domain-containing protein, partial [Egibacteraceae bacterium]